MGVIGTKVANACLPFYSPCASHKIVTIEEKGLKIRIFESTVQIETEAVGSKKLGKFKRFRYCFNN